VRQLNPWTAPLTTAPPLRPLLPLHPKQGFCLAQMQPVFQAGGKIEILEEEEEDEGTGESAIGQ
jgi:hypothetical protein